MKVLHSTRVVLPEGIREAWVVINNKLIEAVHNSAVAMDGAAYIECNDLLVMPGVIDPHVHINDPGREEWEGFDTATKAALAGGVTTLVDMPLNSSPVTTTVAALQQKLDASKGRLHVNVGCWGGVVPGNTADIEPLIKAGVLGFKAFLTHSGIDEFPNATEEDLRKAMPIIARYKLPLLVHCELTDDVQRATGDERSYQNYLQSRPCRWEDDAIAMMIRLSEAFNCHVHIVHLSSAQSIAQLKSARKRGVPITVETGQHYLYFTAEQIPDGQTQYKCAPPIREAANNEQLWLALQEGIIDLVATDHSPATPALKEIESGNFMKAWGGIASIQFALPVLWTAARKRNIPFHNIARWLCEQPALLMGYQHRKGKIAAGFDADIIVVDEAASFTVDATCCHHKHKVSPYMGETLYGVVQQTYIAGELLYANGEFVQFNRGHLLLQPTHA